MKIIGYIRTSTLHQKTSINTQIYLIEHYCLGHGYSCPILFVDEGKSAYDDYTKRKVLIFALDMLDKNDLFIVKNIERLTRSIDDLDTIKKIINNKGAKLIETNPDNMDKLINGLTELLENYYENRIQDPS